MGGCPVGYLQSVAEELNLGLPRANPASGRVEDCNTTLHLEGSWNSLLCSAICRPVAAGGFRSVPSLPKQILKVAIPILSGGGVWAGGWVCVEPRNTPLAPQWFMTCYGPEYVSGFHCLSGPGYSSQTVFVLSRWCYKKPLLILSLPESNLESINVVVLL